MRNQFGLLTLLLFPAFAVGQSSLAPEPAKLNLVSTESTDIDPRQAQVQAATSNGATALREQVLRMPLNQQLKVGEFIEKTNSAEALTLALQAAQSVGGPRWVDDRTCQVRMEISGPRIANFLLSVAHDQPDHSPIKPDALNAQLMAWDRLKFSAIGSSAGGESIELARSHDSVGAWAEIDDHARRQAVMNARADAIGREITSLGSIQLDANHQLKETLAHPNTNDRIASWLNKEPITKIEFLDDLKVSVTIAVSPKTLSRVVKSAVGSDDSFKPGDAIDWVRVKREIESAPAVIVGSATAVPPPATTRPVVVLPIQPPDWGDQPLEAQATSSSNQSSRLKVGRAAENDAIEQIHEQFLALRLNPTTTLADAAKTDPRLSEAVIRAIRLVHTCKVDYQLDGAVRVHVSLDVHDAWDELRAGGD